jgi:hypothetical protein
MPYVSPLVTGFLSRSVEFIPTVVPVGLVVDKITLGQVFVPVLQSSLVSYGSTNNNPVAGNVPNKCHNSVVVY